MTAITRTGPLPLYYQIKQALLQQIQSGEIGPGDALPSERELEERYVVSRITVRRALSELATEGYISRQAGRGTFVLQRKIEHRTEKIAGIRDDLAAEGFDVGSEIVQCNMRSVPSHVARKLGAKEGQPLLYVQRVVYTDDEPLLMTTGYHNFGEGVTFTREELEEDSVFRLLERKYGIAVSRVDRIIEATLALEHEAELLNVRPKSPLLLAELLVYDARGQPISFMKNLYRGDRYKYRHTVAA